VPHLLEQIAYEAALRALDKQEAVVADVRARTGVLLGAASIATSFLAQATTSRVFFVSALASFVVLVAASVRVLLPSPRFEFALRGSVVYVRLFGTRHDAEEIYRELLYEVDALWKRNDSGLRPLLRSYRLAGLALTVEILSLVLLATGTIA
jgi:hypothetical protein